MYRWNAVDSLDDRRRPSRSLWPPFDDDLFGSFDSVDGDLILLLDTSRCVQRQALLNRPALNFHVTRTMLAVGEKFKNLSHE